MDTLLDSKIPFDLVKGCAQEEAVLHLMRWHSFQCSRSLFKNSVTTVRELDRLRDAFSFGLEWIYATCHSAKALPSKVTDPEKLASITTLFDAAIRFSSVNDVMNLIWPNWREITIEENRYALNPLDERSRSLEVIDFMLTVQPLLCFDYDEKLWSELAEESNLTISAPLEISYGLDPALIQRISDEIIAPLLVWELNEEWLVGEYSFLDFRRFWQALAAYALVHSVFCGWAEKLGPKHGDISFPLNTVIPVMSKEEWGKKLALWSGLDLRKVTHILDDLTLRPNLLSPVAIEGRPRPKRSDAIYQPFIPLGEYLALSIGLVTTSNAERNLWDLLSIIRNDEFSVLSSKKEQFWLDGLTNTLTALGLKIRTLATSQGDADCLIFDDEAKFGIAVQLKYLMAFDRVKQKDVDYLKKGQRQAREAVSWIGGHFSKAAQQLEMLESELRRYRIEPMVLTKTSMLTAYLETNVPILCERLLLEMLQKQNLSLLDCWLVAKHELYVPSPLPFDESDYEFEFGGIFFATKNYTCKGTYEPNTHIRFGDLEKLKRQT